MAKDQYLTPHQQGIVRRYYDHKDTLMRQKLAEAVSDLSLCEDEKKSSRLWNTVHKALLGIGVGEQCAGRIVAERDLEEAARIVGKLF